MLRNRLLAATAAFALAMGQMSSGYAALPSPQFQTPAANDNSALGATTSFVSTAIAKLKTDLLILLQQSYTLQVPSAAALRSTGVFSGVVVHRSGYATAGDGGGADYFGSTSACANGDDGGSCLNAPGGSWNIDWSSVGNVASVALFETGAGSGNFATDTTAIQNALNTGLDVVLPFGSAGQYYVATSVLTYKVNNQKITGVGGGRTTIGCTLPTGAGATNPCLNTNGLSSIHLNNIHMYYSGAPDTTNLSALSIYGPLVYAQNSPGMRMDDDIFARANVDVDMRGNSGGSIFTDMKFSCFSTCWQVDGSLDTNSWVNPHGFVYDLLPNQSIVFANTAIGWSFGRMDHFAITNGLFIGHLAFYFFNGTGANAGPAFGSITNFDCDTHSCILGDVSFTGDIQATNVIATLAYSGEQAFMMNNGNLLLSSPTIGISAALTNPAVQAVQGGVIVVDGGDTRYLDAATSTTSATRYDATAFQSGSTSNSGGQIQITNHRIQKLAGSSSTPIANTKPIIAKYGRLTAVGVTMTDSGTLSTSASTPNQFIYDPSDGFDRIIGNVAPGWNNLFPSSVSTAVISGNGPPPAAATPN